ncbi:MAG: hypothetical protein HQ559_11315, partial [Lentisphaerae bacterium]|nr:hypothetical protein [Lentisphaerota bacterium]
IRRLEALLEKLSTMPDAPDLGGVREKLADIKGKAAAGKGDVGIYVELREITRQAVLAKVLVDTTGELRDFYQAATVIFVGRSLVPGGGHSIVEPAVFAKPIVVGPHLENFPVVAADFRSADAMLQVADEDGLQEAIATLLRDGQLRAQYGTRAAGVVKAHAGGVRESVRELLGFLDL